MQLLRHGGARRRVGDDGAAEADAAVLLGAPAAPEVDAVAPLDVGGVQHRRRPGAGGLAVDVRRQGAGAAVHADDDALQAVGPDARRRALLLALGAAAAAAVGVIIPALGVVIVTLILVGLALAPRGAAVAAVALLRTDELRAHAEFLFAVIIPDVIGILGAFTRPTGDNRRVPPAFTTVPSLHPIAPAVRPRIVVAVAVAVAAED
mmetsp:Transcript_14782/g.44512  ORF Transcript_14782/g.44512 Transcript_14782/m.44512 type:complete len:206 (-) Transcript_14782:133-750(-)